MLILLVVALGGVFTVEQPDGSVLEFYPCWRFMLQKVFEHGGPFAAAHHHYRCLADLFVARTGKQHFEISRDGSKVTSMLRFKR